MINNLLPWRTNMNHSIIEQFQKKITVSIMQPNDFKKINQWCIDEGWNIGLQDSEIYYKIDPIGHYIAKNNDNNKSIASISLIKHSKNFFTLGPFIVCKSYRKQGIGNLIFNMAMDRMTQENPDASILLCAVLKQVDRYKKTGFLPVFNIQRWYIDSSQVIFPCISNQYTEITDKLMTAISQYDQNHYFTNRELLFKELLLKKDTKGLVFIDDNVIKGFGFIRPCVHGFRIGVLVSETLEISKSLISGLLLFAKNNPVFIDVPDSNPNAINCMNFFHAVRMPQEDTTMMIKGTGYFRDPIQLDKHYGLFSLEIG